MPQWKKNSMVYWMSSRKVRQDGDRIERSWVGPVPVYPMGRFFRDALGRVNQRLAQVADTVYFMVSGLPMLVKGVSPRPDLH